ncbi:5-formyltetrahydrofolate cyclo-ligase [Legionella oakridgensis]|nr:5-formyltetrahydrofolate cyclo-ligase [Legionella oakridgensis]
MADQFKEALRQTYRLIRKNLPHAYKQAAAKKICTQIRALKEYRYAKRIALYHAIHGEVNLNSLWKSAPLQGKYCYFPILREDLSLLFLPATPATHFYENRYGIQEPHGSLDEVLRPDELDIIFMPLVAFDERGTRLGMGAGYYDRTLAKYKARLLIGVAYDFQRLPFIEAQPWDVPLSAIITDRTIYWSKI